jgi:hypothetical protein
MSKGSALSRAVRYFREAEPDEMRVAFTLVSEIVKARTTPLPPRQKRHRRTRAEMAAAQAAAAPKVTGRAVAASHGALSDLYVSEKGA